MKNLSRKLLRGATLASALLLWGCALEVENTRAAEELARLTRSPGSVYTGWRVFQDRCAGCHGAPATGTVAAPDLLPIVRNMGPHRFVDTVLMRYDWSLPAARASGGSAERDALVEGVMERRQGALIMPEWQGEPRVNAHIMDLYAYLWARAEGTQGPERPRP